MADIIKLAAEAHQKMSELGYITSSTDVMEKHDMMCRSLQSQLSTLRYSSEVIKEPNSNFTQTESALKNIVLICLGELYKRNTDIETLLTK